MFTFLHAADIHLDSPLRKLEYYEGAPVEALRGATRRALENLVEAAVSKAVNFVLISGDLYDGDWRDYNTGLYFVSQMSELRKADIPVFIIAGNHDAASRMTRSLQPLENVHFFPADQPNTVCIDDIGVAIHGQGFPRSAVQDDLSEKYPGAVPGYFNIGMLHTCATGREGHHPYAPCTIEGLQSKGYDYWALGHVHQREVLCKDPLIVFPGNIQGRHIRETGVKGCVMVGVNGDEKPDVRFQPLDVIRWMYCNIDARNAKNGDDILQKVREQLDEGIEKNDGLPLAVRIDITGPSDAHATISEDSDRWRNEIRAAAIDSGGPDIWIEKTKFCTRLPELPDESDTGPMGEIFSLIDDIRAEPEQLKSLDESLDTLRRKLRRELKGRADTVFPDDPEWLLQRVEEVKGMLMRSLTQKGEIL